MAKRTVKNLEDAREVLRDLCPAGSSLWLTLEYHDHIDANRSNLTTEYSAAVFHHKLHLRCSAESAPKLVEKFLKEIRPQLCARPVADESSLFPRTALVGSPTRRITHQRPNSFGREIGVEP